MILLATSCGPTPTATNDEYLEYKERITEIVDDATASNTAPRARQTALFEFIGSNAPFLAPVTDTSADDIFDILASADEKRETTVQSYYQEVFDMATYVPLILGDAITEKHGASEFYGVTIKGPSDQWFRTDKVDNVISTYVYSKFSVDEIFIVFHLDYKSQGDYTFTCLQFDESLENMFYAYGEADGDFIFYRSSPQNDGMSYVISRRGASVGYVISDDEAVSLCADIVFDYFEGYNPAEIKKLENSAEYTITLEEYTESQKKIFPESLEPDYGLLYSENGEETVCYGYGANGEERIVIPEDVVLGEGFVVYDYSGTVKELVLPQSMIFGSEAKTVCDPEGGDFSPLLERVYGNGEIVDAVFERITVPASNPYFKSVDGSLYTKDGEVLMYLSDVPGATELKLDFSRVPKNGIGGLAARDYFNSLKNIEYPLVLKAENDGFSVYDVFERVLHGMAGGTLTPTVNIIDLNVDFTDVIEGGMTARYDIPNMISSLSHIGKLVLVGDFESVLIVDEYGAVYDVELRSGVSGAEIDKHSILPNIIIPIELYITEDYQSVSVADFESVTKLTIEHGVEHFNAAFQLRPEAEIDIYIPDSLISFSLPTIKMEQPTDKDNAQGILGNYRLHLPCNESEFDEYRASHPSVTIGIPFINVFRDTNEEALAEFHKNFPEKYIYQEGIKLVNYYGEDRTVRIPESLYGLPIVAMEFSDKCIDGRTHVTGLIDELFIPATLDELILRDGNMTEKYHFASIIYDGTYGEYTYLGIDNDEYDPDVSISDMFKRRFDILKCTDKTVSPLDKVFNFITNYVGEIYTLTDFYVTYTHADESYVAEGALNLGGYGDKLVRLGAFSGEFTDMLFTAQISTTSGVYTLKIEIDDEHYEAIIDKYVYCFTVSVTDPSGATHTEENVWA